MKQTSSYLEAFETSNSDGSGEQWLNSSGQHLSRGGSGSYHEIYSNLHSNALWLSYSGQPQQQQGTSLHYPETSEPYSNSSAGQQQNCNYTTTDGGQHVEYVGAASEHHQQHQSRSQRPDSLICFSMNFHANSIQVMTTPTTTAAVPSAQISGNGHRGEVAVVSEHEPENAGHYASSSEGSSGQFSNSGSSVSTVHSSNCRTIKCYHSSSDGSQNVAAVSISASASNASSSSSGSCTSVATSNLYALWSIIKLLQL